MHLQLFIDMRLLRVCVCNFINKSLNYIEELRFVPLHVSLFMANVREFVLFFSTKFALNRQQTDRENV